MGTPPLTGASSACGLSRQRDFEPISGFSAWCYRCNRPGVVNRVAGGPRPPSRKLWHIAGSKRRCWLREKTKCNVYDKKPQRYAKDNRTAHLTARSDKSVACVTNNKRLYSTFRIVEANYWQTRSIARPLRQQSYLFMPVSFGYRTKRSSGTGAYEQLPPFLRSLTGVLPWIPLVQSCRRGLWGHVGCRHKMLPGAKFWDLTLWRVLAFRLERVRNCQLRLRLKCQKLFYVQTFYCNMLFKHCGSRLYAVVARAHNGTVWISVNLLGQLWRKRIVLLAADHL